MILKKKVVILNLNKSKKSIEKLNINNKEVD